MLLQKRVLILSKEVLMVIEIEQMLSDPTKLKAEVTKYEQELVALSPKFANFWITSAKALGHHLVTDSVVTKDLLFNAESIAKVWVS